MKPSESTATLTAFIREVWNAGDFSNLDRYLAPAYTVRNDPGDPWDGRTLDRDTFRTRVAYARDAFPDLRFDIHESIEDEGRVAIRWVMAGTHAGDLPELPATGRPFLVSGITFYYFEHGRICGHAQAFDRLGFLSQTGSLGRVLRELLRDSVPQERERHTPCAGSALGRVDIQRCRSDSRPFSASRRCFARPMPRIELEKRLDLRKNDIESAPQPECQHALTDAPRDTPLAVYQIRVEGHLDRRRTGWFEELTATLEEGGVTRLTGPIADQSALHAVLRCVRDLGLPLLSITRVKAGPPEDNPPGTVR